MKRPEKSVNHDVAEFRAQDIENRLNKITAETFRSVGKEIFM